MSGTPEVVQSIEDAAMDLRHAASHVEEVIDEAEALLGDLVVRAKEPERDDSGYVKYAGGFSPEMEYTRARSAA